MNRRFVGAERTENDREDRELPERALRQTGIELSRGGDGPAMGNSMVLSSVSGANRW